MSKMRFAGTLVLDLSASVAEIIDIAVNLTDPMYRGEYHGKSRHQADLDAVVQRALDAGVERILITGTSLLESREALNMAKQYS